MIKKVKRKKLIVFIVITVALGGGLLFLRGFFEEDKSKDVNSLLVSRRQTGRDNTAPTPTPLPFQELTIPYLRKRNYNSRFGELEKVSETDNYSSYLTNYDSDGLKINGLLTRPRGKMPEGGWPGIVFVHGYIPPEQYSTLERYESYVDYLARNGFVVFKIDLRGHGASEGCVCGAYYAPDYVIDTLNAYRALQESDFVNPERIGLWGHSMGGNIVFRSLVIEKEIPAVVVWAGAVYSYEDFQEYGITDNSYRPPAESSENRKRRNRLLETHGEFDPDNSFWKQIIPTNYLNDDVSGSLQLHHAANDSVVSVNYSRNLIEVLKGSSIDAKLYEYSGGGHNITGGSFSVAMQRTVEFFETRL